MSSLTTADPVSDQVEIFDLLEWISVISHYTLEPKDSKGYNRV